jgi:ActR/RegA family two-component response regulator
MGIVFQGLLLTRDDAVIRMFRRIYQELEMELEVCTGAQQAATELEERRFHAVIIDCDDVHCGQDVLANVRTSNPNKRATTFAILNGVTTMSDAFRLGANLTLQKPVSFDHIRKSLLALKGLVEQEHRRYYRIPVDFPVTLMLDENKDFQGVATNISDGGMALKLNHPVPEHRMAELRFALPGSTNRLNAKITVAWSDLKGAMGVRFDYMPPGGRQELNAWLVRNIDLPKKQASSMGAEAVASKSLR